MKKKIIILLTVAYCLGTSVYLFVAGREEDKVVLRRDKQFTEAVYGKNGVDEAIASLHELEKELPPTYTIYQALATKYFNRLDYDIAQKYYAKTVRKRPAIILDAAFDYEYASAAFRNDDIKVANIYLEQVKKVGIPANYQRSVWQLQRFILDSEKEKGK